MRVETIEESATSFATLSSGLRATMADDRLMPVTESPPTDAHPTEALVEGTGSVHDPIDFSGPLAGHAVKSRRGSGGSATSCPTTRSRLMPT